MITLTVQPCPMCGKTAVAKVFDPFPEAFTEKCADVEQHTLPVMRLWHSQDQAWAIIDAYHRWNGMARRPEDAPTPP